MQAILELRHLVVGLNPVSSTIFILDGGHYADYASLMGTMGLSKMHHSTWDNLVSWVGSHVDRLANWSCEQVRADIESVEIVLNGWLVLMAFI